tara:strand:+ start:210 stop:512 length:303 start_codon:yes stop_codon:yes gene_type:complete
MYLEFPIKTEHAEDFFDLCNSSLGFALTKKQPGFISSEWMISTSENGKKCFHLWERWESEEHFTAYMRTPERAPGSKFEISLRKWGDGDTKVFWGVVNFV